MIPQNGRPAWRGGWTQKPRKTIYNKRCVVCKAHFQTAYNQKIYCSGVCAGKAYLNTRRRRNGKSLTCPHCKKDFPMSLVWKGRGGRI